MIGSFTPPAPLKTAVLFLVFNRPDTTAQVFEEIRKALPPRLYVAADGPREGKDGEAERVRKAREISTAVDWPCEVQTLFRDENLGCKQAVSQAITWFFENEEQGIILEDDCLPSQSFFWFCEALLDRYRLDEHVYLISGYNKQNYWAKPSQDYFYSYFGGIWGWASWRRAWLAYDAEMDGLESLIENGAFVKQMGRHLGRIRQNQLIDAKRNAIHGKINSWGYPWALSRHANNGIACVPCVSLIKNIGFGMDATHTTAGTIEKVDCHEIRFPLKFNDQMVCDRKYDYKFLRSMPLLERVTRRVLRMLCGKR